VRDYVFPMFRANALYEVGLPLWSVTHTKVVNMVV